MGIKDGKYSGEGRGDCEGRNYFLSVDKNESGKEKEFLPLNNLEYLKM